MATKDKEIKTRYTVDVDEVELNSLIKELLDGCRDDLSEAESNMQIYLEEIQSNKDGKQLYGVLYNDALKIKGSARDRQLKLLNMFKDRVTTKERIDIETGKNNKAGSTNMTPDMMAEVIQKQIKSKEDAKTEMLVPVAIPNPNNNNNDITTTNSLTPKNTELLDEEVVNEEWEDVEDDENE